MGYVLLYIRNYTYLYLMSFAISYIRPLSDLWSKLFDCQTGKVDLHPHDYSCTKSPSSCIVCKVYNYSTVCTAIYIKYWMLLR